MEQATKIAVVPEILTGLFSGTLMILMAVTYAALIFSGGLAVHVAYGISIAIAASIIVGLIVTLFSDCKQTISQIDDDTAPVFALLVSLVVASVPAMSTPAETLATITMAIVTATFLTGLGLTLFGTFDFGAFIQYLPYSVMGGYFTAVGWLLIVGAINVVTGVELSGLADLKALFGSALLVHWLPALGVAVWLSAMSGRIVQKILLPFTIVIAVCAYFAISLYLGYSPSDLMEQGLLIGPFSVEGASIFSMPSLSDLGAAHWAHIFSNAGTMATILLISIMSIMFCVSGLGIAAKQDVDINRELKIAGLGNMLSAGTGNMAALPSLSLSRLAIDMSPSDTRLGGIIALFFCSLMFYFGMSVIAFIPKFILAAMLMYIGLQFVYDWLIQGLKKFSFSEYLVIPVILFFSISAGFLVGIFVGMIAAIILFVVKYSQIKIIRYELSGASMGSNVERDPETQRQLRAHGEQILLLSLQGYLFFGTAGSLYNRLVARVSDHEQSELNYLVMDFSQVTGVDSSAANNFQKIARLCETHTVFLIAANLDAEMLGRLYSEESADSFNSFLVLQPDLDHGLEWCENHLMAKENFEGDLSTSDFFSQVSEYLDSEGELAILKSYLTEMQVEKNYELTKQDSDSNELFFIETCSASAYIYYADGQPHRVRRTGRGTVYGEIGFFLGTPRSATVVIDEPGIVYSLTLQALKEMESANPEVAAGLNRYLAKMLTERLFLTTQALRAVLM